MASYVSFQPSVAKNTLKRHVTDAHNFTIALEAKKTTTGKKLSKITRKRKARAQDGKTTNNKKIPLQERTGGKKAPNSEIKKQQTKLFDYPQCVR